MTCSYMIHEGSGTRYGTIHEAGKYGMDAGDSVVIRDLTALIPDSQWSHAPEAGKWRNVPYRLTTHENGSMLMVNQRDRERPRRFVPPPIEIPLFLKGWYAVWIGVPLLELTPRAYPVGIDAALDCDCYVHLYPEFGIRRGKLMGGSGCEILKFLTCAQLDNRSLRLRIPNGSFSAYPFGLCRAMVSSVHLVKLSDAQAHEWQDARTREDTKRVMVVCDGFSHYWQGGPENLVDGRVAAAHRDSDVGAIMLQTPSTGTVNYPSRIAPIPGEGFRPEDWRHLRAGDKTVHEYLKWAGANGCEGFAALPNLCHRWGMKCYMSLRTNLFLDDRGKFGDVGRFANGDFWKENPGLRKPGSLQLDYGKPETRQFLYDLIHEAIQRYDLDGFHYDWTRWPPIFDPKRHTDDVPVTMLRETRALLDRIGLAGNKRFDFGLSIVDGYHARMTLKEQKLGFEKLAACGALDFICVEAWDHREYLAIARRYGLKYYAVVDQEPIDKPLWSVDDPDWREEPDKPLEDPVLGEEMMEQPPLNSTLDPMEYQIIQSRFDEIGVDGTVIVNNFFGRCIGGLGHPQAVKHCIAEHRSYGQVCGGKIECEY